MTATPTAAVFPSASRASGMYESFYLRAVHPERPLGAWIRYTVHKRPEAAPTGSLWFTLFEGGARPLQQKLTLGAPTVPQNGWIAIGDASIGAAGAAGTCGKASWSLRVHEGEPELRHLAPGWLYSTPLPRTKLTSPNPAARFDGSIQVRGREPIALAGWRGMVGHNWGSQHAERWIWLHGIGFDGAPEAWVDVGLARVRVGGRLSPWLASGAVSIGGARHRLGGLSALRSTVVEEAPGGCRLRLAGADGLRVQLTARVPGPTAAGWRYADPDGGEHDVVNCSIAELDLDVRRGGTRGSLLRTAAGGAYELGMRERTHGIPLAPYPDG